MSFDPKFMRLVGVFCARCKKGGLPPHMLDDLESYLTLKLVQALTRYDPAKDVRSDTDRAGETYVYGSLKWATSKFLHSCRAGKNGIARKTKAIGRVGPKHRHYKLVQSKIDPSQCEPVERFLLEDEVNAVKSLVSERDWQLLVLRLGMELTLAEIGRRFNASPERARQLTGRAEERLRARLYARNLLPYRL